MSEAKAEEIIRIALDLAVSGDKTMLRMCIDRLVARVRERPASIELPAVNSAIDRAPAIDAIRTAQAAGDITVAQAEGMARLVDLQIAAIELSDHARGDDELLQTRGLGIARLAPKISEASVGDDGAPANDASGAPADNDTEGEKDAAPGCAIERDELRVNDSPSANGGFSTTDPDSIEPRGTSTKGNLDE
jgi:hypothetical protein